MVKMNLLKIDEHNQLVYFRCVPEDEECNSFVLGLDLINKNIVSNTLGKMNSYVIHAARKIYEIYEQTKDIPQNAISVWY